MATRAALLLSRPPVVQAESAFFQPTADTVNALLASLYNRVVDDVAAGRVAHNPWSEAYAVRNYVRANPPNWVGEAVQSIAWLVRDHGVDRSVRFVPYMASALGQWVGVQCWDALSRYYHAGLDESVRTATKFPGTMPSTAAAMARIEQMEQAAARRAVMPSAQMMATMSEAEDRSASLPLFNTLFSSLTSSPLYSTEQPTQHTGEQRPISMQLNKPATPTEYTGEGVAVAEEKKTNTILLFLGLAAVFGVGAFVLGRRGQAF